MSYTGIKIVFGTANLGFPPFESVEDVKGLLDVVDAGGVKVLDTAQFYGNSESLLGQSGAATRFVIDTKELAGFDKEGPSKDAVIRRGHESLENLETKKVDIFYLHAPHPTHPISDTLAGMDALQKAGAFSRLGLSNFKPEDVEAVYNLCKEKNYVLPTVYQGNYNPVARKQEESLFPVLRKLGMAFYAYSPLAGGFLTKTKEQIQDGAGRFRKDTMPGQMYLTLYARPSYLEALEQWHSVADKEGVGRAELAYRWVAHNSPLKPEYGDAIIVGASRVEQDAPLDNWHDYASTEL